MLLKVLLIILGSFAAVFVILGVIALLKKPSSVYSNDPQEKNIMENRTVTFVYDDNDPENADGVKGHLVASCENTVYRASVYEKVVKRILDIVFSFFALVFLSPVFLIISLLIFLDDPGHVLFTQKRVGKNKQYFKLHKFRSMKLSTPHDVPTHMLEDAEKYITKVGKFIRSHSLDELPQLWDIFIGNMSLVGPRPGLWNQDLLTSERDKYSANSVKPGLTGWAQLNGRDDISIEEKALRDGEYVSALSFKMDCKCFFRSFGVFGKDENITEGKAVKNIKKVEYEK